MTENERLGLEIRRAKEALSWSNSSEDIRTMYSKLQSMRQELLDLVEDEDLPWKLSELSDRNAEVSCSYSLTRLHLTKTL